MEENVAMIAFAEGFNERPRPARGGFSPSMAGSENEDIMDFAQHLQTNAPLGPNGQEAFRMARAQAPQHQIATFRRAIEIAMSELANRAMRELEVKEAMAD